MAPPVGHRAHDRARGAAPRRALAPQRSGWEVFDGLPFARHGDRGARGTRGDEQRAGRWRAGAWWCTLRGLPADHATSELADDPAALVVQTWTVVVMLALALDQGGQVVAPFGGGEQAGRSTGLEW